MCLLCCGYGVWGWILIGRVSLSLLCLAERVAAAGVGRVHDGTQCGNHSEYYNLHEMSTKHTAINMVPIRFHAKTDVDEGFDIITLVNDLPENQ